MINVLNLGAGKQSSLLFLMACRGEVDRPDYAICADTTWERAKTYAHLEWLKEMGAEAGIPVVVRSRGNLREDALAFRSGRKSEDGKRYASIPAYVRNLDGSVGIIKRQCTSEYKIELIDRIIRREILGLKPKQHAPKKLAVRQWFGISIDEQERMSYPGSWQEQTILDEQRELFTGQPVERKIKVWKPALWRSHFYPLCGVELMSDRSKLQSDMMPTMTRAECVAWLEANYPGREIPRSSCIGCPYHGNDEWKDLRDNSPDEWRDAVAFDYEHRESERERDNASRKGKLVGELYLHRQCVPLDMVDLDSGNGSDGMFSECQGMCGV